MGRHKLTVEEERAYAALARAAKRLREAQARAEEQRQRERSKLRPAGLEFAADPQREGQP